MLSLIYVRHATKLIAATIRGLNMNNDLKIYSEVRLNMAEKTKYKDDGLWLNISKTGKGLTVKSGNDYYYCAISILQKNLAEGKNTFMKKSESVQN